MWTPDQERTMDLFDAILIDHPRKNELHNALGTLMHETTRASRRYQQRMEAAGGRPIKAEELYLLPVIGPSGATKTKSLSTYVDTILGAPDLDPQEIPVLVVTVRNSVKSTRHLQSAILLAFGDVEASLEVLSQRDYSEARVNMDLLEKARARKTRIVILDECHSMIQNAGPVLLDNLATAMKSFVNDGLFSLVLVGTDRVKRLLQFSENHSRQKRTIDFGAASLDDPQDVAYFMQFVGRFEKEMVASKVIERPLGLIADVATRAIVFDMARGVVGTVVRILRLALEQSFEDDAPLDWTHVVTAFRAWNRALEKPGYDPFSSKKGSAATEAKLKAIEAAIRGGRRMTWRYSKDKLVPTEKVVPAFITMQPEPDESLVGFIDRTFARTVFANPISALARAGIATNRPDFLASAELTDAQVQALAVRLGTDQEAIRTRLYPDTLLAGSDVRGVDFYGQFLRLTFLERERRRVSPRALEHSPHHRAIWDIRPLAYDPGTMELLLAHCPVCRTPLGRRRLFGPEKCDTCRDERGLPSTDLRDHPQPMVPEEQREMLRAIAGLVDTDPKVRERSCRIFPEPWRSLGPGDLFHILVEMSVANAGATGQLGPSSPFLPLSASALHRVGEVVADGVETFYEWAGTTLTRKDLPHWTVDRPMATTGFERLVKCPHVSLEAKRLLQEMRSGSRTATRLRRTGSFAWLNAKDLAGEFDLDLGRAQMIVTRLKSVFGAGSGSAATGLPTTKEEFAALLPRAQGTVSLNTAASILKSGVEVVSGLEEIGVLTPVPQPASLLIEASKSFYEADVRELRSRFLSAVECKPGAGIFPTVETALKNSALRPLPLSAAWHLVMSGKVRTMSGKVEPGDWQRDIHVADEASFMQLLMTHPLTRFARDLPAEVTTQVAAQMMDSDIAVVGLLVKHGILVPTTAARPLLFSRADIERFVATYVSTPELKRALRINNAGPLDRHFHNLPQSAFNFPNQRSRFYLRKDCASLLAAATTRAA